MATTKKKTTEETTPGKVEPELQYVIAAEGLNIGGVLRGGRKGQVLPAKVVTLMQERTVDKEGKVTLLDACLKNETVKSQPKPADKPEPAPES
jgi:hypothetical protein